ncbi:MAG: hypothetical protein COB30_016510 [Ectothiorhodospiraceae bacterium]|nr:hypothetical protein [Ectothiorhodospiraceae bacterium]
MLDETTLSGAVLQRDLVEYLQTVTRPEGLEFERVLAANKAYQGKALMEVSRLAGIHRAAARTAVSHARQQYEDAILYTLLLVTLGMLLGVGVAIAMLKKQRQMQSIITSEQTQLEILSDVRGQELEAYSYSLAHDLYAPLRAVSGFSQILEEDLGKVLNKSEKHQLHRIRNAGLVMSKIIDDLLVLSRISRSSFKKAHVNLTALCTDVITELQKLHPHRKLTWLSEANIEVEGDGDLLLLMMEQLLSNAWECTSEQHDAMIQVGVKQVDGRRAIYVTDNGTGFDIQFAGRLSMVFKHQQADGNAHGAGMGLAIAQRIVKRHGGQIWVDSTVDKGTTVYFNLPEVKSANNSWAAFYDTRPAA